MAVVPREAAELLRVVVVPVERATDEAERAVPGAAERETLVRPVEERRAVRATAELPVVEPPARVRPLLRPDAPPRETKLRVLREASRWPAWRAWLFCWIQRPDQPPTP